jgi:hypothetical protein
MTISNARDYVAAVAKKQHLQELLEDGAKQFYGYGRELFETSIRANLDRLDTSIAEFELRAGYRNLAWHNVWIIPTKDESIEVRGGTILTEPRLAGSTWSLLTIANFHEGNACRILENMDIPVGSFLLFQKPSSLYFGNPAANEPIGAF